MMSTQLLPALQPSDHDCRHIIADSMMALGSTALLTAIMLLFHLYPTIVDSFLLYLLVILALAGTRGLYPAVLASIIAFFSFDFFFVSPVYSLLITKFQDILTLIVFMVVAIMTSQLASALRLRAKQAQRREQETRILYNLVRATNSEADLHHALTTFVQAVVEVFFPWGIRDCTLFLPDAQHCFTQQIGAYTHSEQPAISAKEQKIIAQVAQDAHTLDLYYTSHTSNSSIYTVSDIESTKEAEKASHRFIRLVPLKTEQHVVGVLRLLVEDNPRHVSIEQSLGREHEQTTPQAVFFSTFLEHAVAIIERERLRQENMQVKVLQQTDALRSALLSSVSHDLRTPLSTIKTSATSLLTNEIEWDEDARRSFISAIEREADRLNSLVENLLDMSRIEAGALRPDKVWYPLNALIQDVLDRMYRQLQGRVVQTQLPEQLPPIQLDCVYIDQVITNLIENAIYYTPAGSPLDISVQVQDKQVLVGVADRGPGISPFEREHIFDKFYRVHRGTPAQRHTHSSGLGLAICRGVVEAHGGSIRVEPRDGGGAVFYFSLPFTAIESVSLDE